LHPEAQRTAMAELLDSIGNTDVLKVVETDDGYMLVDGHLRQELFGTARVKVAVLDLDERETKQLLEAFDRVGGMAETDEAALEALLADIAATDLPTCDDEDVGLAILAIQEEPEVADRAARQAQATAGAVANNLQRIADQAPELLNSAQAVIVPTDGHCEALIIADHDLHDIIAELRQRHEDGETHPLDALFAAIWTP
jgi:hypothetical protein